MAKPDPQKEGKEKGLTKQQDQSPKKVKDEAKPQMENLVFALPTVPDPRKKSNS
jgi:hypothetical protein